MNNKALGLIETYGYIGAVEAADVCLKTANVILIGSEFIRGGLVTIMIRGDVAAVKASVEAAEGAVEKIGHLISTHVIPRPFNDIEKILPDLHTEVKEERESDMDVNLGKDPVEDIDENINGTKGSSQEKPVTDFQGNEKQNSIKIKTEKELKAMKVVDLRSLARELEEIPMERNHIKYARKKELIEAILQFYERVK